MCTRAESLNVAIGPAIDLHPGIHGALLASPPAGVTFDRRDGTHVFLFPPGSAYPDVFETPHWGEYVSLGSGAAVAHSPRWPVLDARAWIADMDDFGYPVLGGRTLFNEAFWGQLRREVGRPGGPPAEHAIRLRISCMLRAYAHPSCRAILFMTELGLARAAQLIRDVEAGADGEAFLRKAQVLGPAAVPLPRERVLTKWQGQTATNVLFCGTGWRLKNGPLAVRAMAHLAVKHPAARFLYVGDTPPEYREERRRRALPSSVRLLGRVPHEHVKTLFEGAHILFHPSRSESFGMVLLEAAAAGLAVVCARGRGMEHAGEIVGEHGAATLDRRTIAEADEEAAFTSLLDGLLSDRRAAQAMGMWNHAHVEGSMLSAANRNAALSSLYHHAAETAAPEPLRERDLSPDRPAAVVRMSSRDLREAENELRLRTGADAPGVRVEIRSGARA